jgi:hypothetical protein
MYGRKFLRFFNFHELQIIQKNVSRRSCYSPGVDCWNLSRRSCYSPGVDCWNVSRRSCYSPGVDCWNVSRRSCYSPGVDCWNNEILLQQDAEYKSNFAHWVICNIFYIVTSRMWCLQPFRIKSPGALSVSDYLHLRRLNTVCVQHLRIYRVSRTSKRLVTTNNSLEWKVTYRAVLVCGELTWLVLRRVSVRIPSGLPVILNLVIVYVRVIHDCPFHSTLYSRNGAVKQSWAVIIYRNL